MIQDVVLLGQTGKGTSVLEVSEFMVYVPSRNVKKIYEK